MNDGMVTGNTNHKRIGFGLDPRAKRELAVLTRSLACTRLISSHDLNFIRGCTDRIILLNHGRIVADGLAGEILDDKGLLEGNGL